MNERTRRCFDRVKITVPQMASGPTEHLHIRQRTQRSRSHLRTFVLSYPRLSKSTTTIRPSINHDIPHNTSHCLQHRCHHLLPWARSKQRILGFTPRRPNPPPPSKPEDRDCLRNEASRISPHQDQTFFVIHPLLNQRLVLTSFDTNRQLARTIQTLHLVIAVECGRLHSTLPFVIWHTQHVLIRDPLNLVVDPAKFASTLHLEYKNPIEILVLKNGDRIRPLAL
jgi:hypothetical protein